jgi:hypothetical protein
MSLPDDPLPPTTSRDLFLPDSLETLSTVIAALGKLEFDTLDNVLTAIHDEELCGELSKHGSSVSNLNARSCSHVVFILAYQLCQELTPTVPY